MKMIDQTTICPYTGLRSFTEEESLYFKGRDKQIDQISVLLEKNKFLMVTGASGEGKSSLIYAGLVPNARAGFFKAKYSNWVVADFRPERSPVKNMAKALAEKLGHSTATIETELKRGFSSLIDLYTNSDFYLPDEQAETASVDRKRKSANLMILVDQFEEFFTNPENFYNEAPSQDSQVVVNLILETARIALAKNIPVYIVCTMRSDYIGQCTAFRGLPEYIGFSQFFVPRLKRKDLKQVIEEPAVLSGNRITQRLVERVVYDLSDGIDQLPILQHAMSQIWLAADRGSEEMDLIHYAMVGGMPADDLPETDRQRFAAWMDSQPVYRKKYYESTGLQKIIEIHASLLYESAWEKSSKSFAITQQDAKLIIAIAFSCLTKIDNSRAVRNRMTLSEITTIINDPNLSIEKVSHVLSEFRGEGNSFVRPFKTDDATTHQLKADSVLDITHESLIRNWGKLIKWAQQEFTFYTTYLDFRKQMDRWKESGKSSSYLLPIGPLTYFESWYDQCKPNVGWIKRYAEVSEDQEQSSRIATEILSDTQEFLKRSAQKVIVTRTFMKYGPQRIATVFAIVAMIFLSGFYWYDAEQKQNDKVVDRLRKETALLMQSNEVGNNIKATNLLVNERLDSGSLLVYLDGLEAKSAIGLAIESYKILLEFNKKDRSTFKTSLINAIENRLQIANKSGMEATFLITELNKFVTLLVYDEYYNPSESTKSTIKKFTDLGFDLSILLLTDHTKYNSTLPSEINYAIQNWLTFAQASPERISTLLSTISPIEGASAKRSFEVYYPKGSYETNGRVPNDFNGGYHTLASLYASIGQVDKIIWSFEQLKQAGQNDYFTASLFNNYNHILGILYQFGFSAKSGEMISWLSKNYVTDTPLTIYRNSFIRSGYLSVFYQVNIEKNILRSNRGYFFPNLTLNDRKVSEELSANYEKEINRISNSDERNYLLTLNYKRKAMFADKYSYDREIPRDEKMLNEWLQKSIEHFKQISSEYLNGVVPVTLQYYTDGVRNRQYKRKHMLLYPDYMDGWFSLTYHSDLFFNFLNERNLFSELYKESEDLDFIHLWIARAYQVKPFTNQSTFENHYPMSDATLETILRIVGNHPSGKGFDRNILYLMLANRSFEQGDNEKGHSYFSLFDQSSISRSADKYEYLEKTFFFNQMKDLCVNLADHGYYKEAETLADQFTEVHEKIFAYLYMADRIFENRGDPKAFYYLDSIFSKTDKVDINVLNSPTDHRFNLLMVLGRIGSEKINDKALGIYSEMQEGPKFGALISMVIGTSDEGNLYRAVTAIPPTLTETQDLICRSIILWQAARNMERGESTRWKSMDNFLLKDNYYVNYFPN